MTQNTQAGASHLPRASPGSGRVTISVAASLVSVAGDDGVGSGEGLGCRIQVGRLHARACVSNLGASAGQARPEALARAGAVVASDRPGPAPKERL